MGPGGDRIGDHSGSGSVRGFSQVATTPSAMSQRYPTPDIQLFLARMEDSLRPIFSPAQLIKYRAAVNTAFLESPPLDIAGRALQKIEADHPDSDNWHSSFFSTIYGGIRTPVAASDRLSLRLEPPTPPAAVDPQVYSAARYLRAIGIWAVHLQDGETFTPQQKALKYQMDGYFYTFVNPGLEMDELYTVLAPDNINATVFYRGVPHLVQIAGSRVVLSVEAISAQLAIIKAKQAPPNILPIAAYSWRLGRTEWCRVFQQLLRVNENRPLFELLKTSVVTVALEGDSPSTTSEFMNNLRGDTDSPNRYSDQTLALAVYEDGEMGLVVDHAPADFGALIQLATILGIALRADRFPQCASAVSPQALCFKYPNDPLPELPTKYEEPLTRSLTTFDLSPPTDGSIRPSDALLNITFQVALLAARPGLIQPIYQPVHQGDFIGGRTDAMWPLTVESTAFVSRLLSIGDVPTDPSELKELERLLGEATEKRRKLVGLSRSWKAPDMFNHGFLSWVMKDALADETAPEDFKQSIQIVLDAWSKASGENVFPSSPTDDTIVPVAGKFSTIQFTGFALPEHDPTLGEYPLEGGILSGFGNIYLPDQLALLYIVRPDRSIGISLGASGHFQKDAENVRRHMEIWYPKIIRVWGIDGVRTC